MKITKELENKINRLLNEKYDTQLSNLRRELLLQEDYFIDSVVKEIKTSISKNPYFEHFINNQTSSWESTDRYLEKNIRKFTDVPEDEQLKQKISELELKKKTEKEDLLIAISYQKDLDGIKEVFEKMGLNF